MKVVVAHPGASILYNTTAHSPGSVLDRTLVRRMLRPFGQGQGDRALPLLAVVVASDAVSGDFHAPSVLAVLGRVCALIHSFSAVVHCWARRAMLCPDKAEYTSV